MRARELHRLLPKYPPMASIAFRIKCSLCQWLQGLNTVQTFPDSSKSSPIYLCLACAPAATLVFLMALKYSNLFLPFLRSLPLPFSHLKLLLQLDYYANIISIKRPSLITVLKMACPSSQLTSYLYLFHHSYYSLKLHWIFIYLLVVYLSY